MTVPPARSRASSFEVVVTAMFIGCLAGAAVGAAVGALTRRDEPEIGLLAAALLLAGCIAGGIAGTAWCVIRRRRRAVATTPAPTVATLAPPEDRSPGWHTDPAGTRRLWDGERWTQHVWSDRHRPT